MIVALLGLALPVQASIEQTNGSNITFKIGSSSTTLVQVGELSTTGLGISGSLNIYTQTSAAAAMEMGQGRTGDGYAYIDLHGDATYSDYGLRIIRNPGANADSDIFHRGTGALYLFTQDAGPIIMYTGSVYRMQITPAGLVGIGTVTPLTVLDVTGAIYSRTFNNSASTTVDWSKSNTQYTSASCGAFTFSNMQDGGVYSLAVQGTTSGTCSFTHTGLTFKYPSDHAATTASTQTLYSFQRMGTVVYVAWIRGY